MSQRIVPATILISWLSVTGIVAVPTTTRDGADTAVARGMAGGPAALNGSLPEKLSRIGMFADVKTLAPAEGVFAYDVNYPLWSDGTVKERHAYLPTAARIGIDEDGWFAMPIGSVLTKTFSSPVVPPSRKHARLETRVLYRATAGWQVATYVWNEAGNDAVRTSGDAVTLPIRLPGSDADYVVPDRVTCLQCHAGVPDYAIGFAAFQIDAATLRRLKLGRHFESDPPTLPNRDFEAATPVERDAVGYLAGNCAHCHNPGASAFVGDELDLRPQRVKEALVGAGAVRLMRDDVRTLVVPGDQEKSVLYRLFTRTLSTTTDRVIAMPPVGNHLIDPHGERVIAAWIEELGRNRE